jgi:alanine dehydrogenase
VIAVSGSVLRVDVKRGCDQYPLMLFLTESDVRELLDIDVLVERLAGAMADLSEGSATMPPRIAAEVAERDALLAVMPAYLPSSRVLATKLVTLFPHNRDRPTHQAIVACFEPDTGTPQAVMDGTYITEARTAAGSALATKLLAREEAETLAVLGTGAQARAHARAVVRVRPIERVRLAGRDFGKAARVASELSDRLGLEVRAVRDYEAASRDADVVCACTHSPDPVVRRTWIAPGTHVNSVGFNTAGREVDSETVADALVVVESRASALADPPAGANDLVLPIREGVVPNDHVRAEIGELVSGRARGRTSSQQITLYKSVGVAVQDAAAAALVLEAAAARGVGATIDP